MSTSIVNTSTPMTPRPHNDNDDSPPSTNDGDHPPLLPQLATSAHHRQTATSFTITTTRTTAGDKNQRDRHSNDTGDEHPPPALPPLEEQWATSRPRCMTTMMDHHDLKTKQRTMATTTTMDDGNVKMTMTDHARPARITTMRRLEDHHHADYHDNDHDIRFTPFCLTDRKSVV